MKTVVDLISNSIHFIKQDYELIFKSFSEGESSSPLDDLKKSSYTIFNELNANVQKSLSALKQKAETNSITHISAAQESINIIKEYYRNLSSVVDIFESTCIRAQLGEPDHEVLEDFTKSLFYLNMNRKEARYIDTYYDNEYKSINKLTGKERLEQFDKEIELAKNIIQYHTALLPFKNSIDKVERSKKAAKNKLKAIKTSYEWLGSNVDAQLEYLYNGLCKQHIVKTTVDDFKAAFKQQPIGSFAPIRWVTHASEIIHLIKILIEAGLINGDLKRFDYICLKGCFVQRNGMPFKHDFKNLKKDLEINLSYDTRQQIDVIVNSIL